MEILRTIILKSIKAILFVFYCLTYPFIKVQCLKKKGQCTSINNEILLLPATDIARKIRKREISCEEVITAYVTRCNEVNPLINAIVADRFKAAIQEAQNIDDFLKTTTLDEADIAYKKPLLGIPITVKESISVQGMSYCVGVKEDTLLKATCDADVVAKVREAGGIPLLVSNTPELCMWWDTFNKVTGTTKNPYDTRRAVGGSSGGEAALLGAGASVLGLGSDIAGSLRIPSLFCGIFAHKPTPHSVSSNGHKPKGIDENWEFYFTIGPMVRYAVDLPLLLTTISPSAETKINFNKVRLEDIKFFYMNDCGSAATNPVNNEMKNMIHKLVKHLETTYTITVQEAKLEKMKSAFELSYVIIFKLKDFYSAFNRLDDPTRSKSAWLEIYKYIFCMSLHSFSIILYKCLKGLLERIPQSYHNKMMEERTLLKKEIKDLLGDNGVLIFPSFTSSAHYYSFECVYNLCNYTYLMIFNALGLPVTQCPLGFDRNQLPIGLQIVANPNCDHLTIAVAQEIERSFGGWQQPRQYKKKISVTI